MYMHLYRQSTRGPSWCWLASCRVQFVMDMTTGSISKIAIECEYSYTMLWKKINWKQTCYIIGVMSVCVVEKVQILTVALMISR